MEMTVYDVFFSVPVSKTLCFHPSILETERFQRDSFQMAPLLKPSFISVLGGVHDGQREKKYAFSQENASVWWGLQSSWEGLDIASAVSRVLTTRNIQTGLHLFPSPRKHRQRARVKFIHGRTGYHISK